MTIRTTASVMPRQDNSGTGRTYSSGGPPWMLSTSGGFLKNNRGRRSLRLKLEVDKGITISLSQDDGARHESPPGCHNPGRRTHHSRFDIRIAQEPVHENHPAGDKSDLKHLASGENGVTIRMSTKHAPQHSRGDSEIRCPKKNPRDTDSSKGGEPADESGREGASPRFMFE